MHTDWHRSIHLFQCLLLILLPLLLLAQRVTLPTRLANKSTFSVWQGRCVNGMDTPETGRISVTLQMSVPAQGAEGASWLLHYLILLTPAPGTSGVKSQPQCWFERSCYFFFFCSLIHFHPRFESQGKKKHFQDFFSCKYSSWAQPCFVTDSWDVRSLHILRKAWNTARGVNMVSAGQHRDHCNFNYISISFHFPT